MDSGRRGEIGLTAVKVVRMVPGLGPVAATSLPMCRTGVLVQGTRNNQNFVILTCVPVSIWLYVAGQLLDLNHNQTCFAWHKRIIKCIIIIISISFVLGTFVTYCKI